MKPRALREREEPRLVVYVVPCLLLQLLGGAGHSPATLASPDELPVGVANLWRPALTFSVPTTTAQDDPPRQHLRMYTRSEFNLWREALSPIIANTALHAQSSASISAGSKPSAVHAAQKWLSHAEGGAASCS